MKFLKFYLNEKKRASPNLKSPNDDIPSLIGQMDFATFDSKDLTVIPVEPIRCSACGAIITDFKQAFQTSTGIQLKCIYCKTDLKIESSKLQKWKEYSLPKEFEILVEEDSSITTKEEVSLVQESKENAIVAVLDISGSMSGSNLNTVKNSLIQTLRNLSETKPNTLFALVTFESQVRIYPIPDQSSEILLNSFDDKNSALEELTGSLSRQNTSFSLSNSLERWCEFISSLNAKDLTALGPGLVSGVQLLRRFSLTGQILLLTDGLANRGFGRLDSIPLAEDPNRRFYLDYAQELADQGISVNIVGIKGSQLDLATLVYLCKETGGRLFYVDTSEMEDKFQYIGRQDVVLPRADISLVLPPGYSLKSVPGSRNLASHNFSFSGLTKDRAVTFAIDGAIQNEAPLQVQIRYEKEGKERIRVYNESISSQNSQAEQEVMARFFTQVAGEKVIQEGLDRAIDYLQTTLKTIEHDKFDMAEKRVKTTLEQFLKQKTARDLEDNYDEDEESDMGLASLFG